MCHLFPHSLIVKQVYLTDRWDPIECYHLRLKWTWEQSQRRGTPHSSKLLQNWSFTIRLFDVISWTLVGRVLPHSSRCILQPQPTGLSVLPLCSLLVYYRYTNANIDSWWLMAQLNISLLSYNLILVFSSVVFSSSISWTHKRCTLMDPHTWPRKSRTTSSNVHSAAMWGYRMLSRRPT